MQKYKQYSNEGMNKAAAQLIEYRRLLKETERLTTRADEFRQQCCDIKAQRFDIERITGGVKKDSADLIIKYSDMEMEARVKLQEMERLMFQIECRLFKLPLDERVVLEAYYINNYSIDKIAKTQGYSYIAIIKKKEQALENYARL